jgi:hypothetical protein
MELWHCSCYIGMLVLKDTYRHCCIQCFNASPSLQQPLLQLSNLGLQLHKAQSGNKHNVAAWQYSSLRLASENGLALHWLLLTEDIDTGVLHVCNTCRGNGACTTHSLNSSLSTCASAASFSSSAARAAMLLSCSCLMWRAVSGARADAAALR